MSNDENLYKTPEAKVADVVAADAPLELAPRLSRLLAAIIDTIIALLFSVPFMFFYGMFEYTKRGIEPPFEDLFVALIFGIVVFILVHGYFLANSGQTIGKKILGIAAVSYQDESVLPLHKILALRYLPLWIVTLVPIVKHIVPLVDVLFIFRKDRRCLHDHIAGTKVVKLN